MQAPGTLLSTTQLTPSKVLALHTLPGGGRLLITPTLTPRQHTRLTTALLQLYTNHPHSIYDPRVYDNRLFSPRIYETPPTHEPYTCESTRILRVPPL